MQNRCQTAKTNSLWLVLMICVLVTSHEQILTELDQVHRTWPLSCAL